MKLEPIEVTQRLYVRVARRIAELVTSGQVKAGEKLPSERDLADMLKVSRPTVREAMIALEFSGLIEVRTGSGIYVKQAQHSAPALVQDKGIGPFDIFELRLMVEPEAAAQAAERMTDQQINALRCLVDDMAALDHTAELEEVDLQFHNHIARGTENAATVSAVDWLWRLRRHSHLSSGFHRMIMAEGVFPVIEQHRAIVQAIASRNPDAARNAMRAHLEASTRAAATHFEVDDP